MNGKIFKSFSFFSATIALIVLVAIFGTLYYYASDSIHTFGFWDFITGTQWEVGEDDEGGVFGGAIPIVGSLLTTAIAMIIALPLALGIAIFLTEIAHEKLVKPVSIAIELLAAIPSIIYGMWGLFYLAPLVQKYFGGAGIGLFTAGVVLAIMIIPFIASITKDAMNTTPSVLKESAYAMGATKFEVIKDVVIPYAKTGIIGSIILALGRALGETMAVAFLLGSVMKFPKNLFDTTTSIPVILANTFSEAEDLELSSLFYLALILFALSFFIISLAKFYFLRNKEGR